MSFPSAPDFGNVTNPLLVERFAEYGATYVPTNHNEQDQAVNALLSDQADFMQSQLNTVVIANAAGADFRSVMNVKKNEWALVTPVSITDPTQLTDKRVGIHGAGTLTELLVNFTIETYNIQPEVLVVPGSEARAAALIADQLDASPADIATVIGLEKQAPGRFHVLIDYNDIAPFLGSTLVVRQKTIDADPEFVQAVVTVWAALYRELLADPSPIAAAAAEYLPDLPAEEVGDLTEAYIGREYWAPELTAETVTSAVQFMVDAGDLTEADKPTAEELSDLTFIANATP
jgi:ABC-type nitrate/sulfonate/bicarbonate transport system substrate-binding protein